MKKWQPWHGRRLISEQQLASHMVVRRGRVHSTMWDACLIRAVAWTSFYYVTKLWHGSYNTCPPGVSIHSKLNCHFIDVGAYSGRRIKDLASKSCYKTLCHAGLFCGASGRREERKNLHHLWRRVQNEICASKGFPLKMGRLCATAKCQSGLFVFTFQRRGCRIVVLFSPKPNKH